ncbi:MAG: DNA cytosine methyltransferase [Candidatus Thiodiazotropha weberae]|nr:DNA cytosine methyltransferase [Candidatus Thiodiazotropha weberae]
MDRAFMDSGFTVIPGCEIDPEMREMHREVCGTDHLTSDLTDLPNAVNGLHFDGIIGGPPCQAHTKLRAIRNPKYPDLTPQVNALLDAVSFDWFLFENVAPIDIPGSESVRLNAMHFYQPHQSRARWFTYKGMNPPKPVYTGTVDDLMAYSVVAGRIYGPKRGARLQGYSQASELPFPCVQLQKGLANAVPYPVAKAWAESIMDCRNAA